MVRESSTCPSVEGAISSLPSACCTWALRGGCAKEGGQPFARPSAHTPTWQHTITLQQRFASSTHAIQFPMAETQYARRLHAAAYEASNEHRVYAHVNRAPRAVTNHQQSLAKAHRPLCVINRLLCGTQCYFTVRCRFCARGRQELHARAVAKSLSRAGHWLARPFPGRLSPPRASLCVACVWPLVSDHVEGAGHLPHRLLGAQFLLHVCVTTSVLDSLQVLVGCSHGHVHWRLAAAGRGQPMASGGRSSGVTGGTNVHSCESAR